LLLYIYIFDDGFFVQTFYYFVVNQFIINYLKIIILILINYFNICIYLYLYYILYLFL
jgi:hypothetical protein